eukprot:1703544-Alexandrium_andersonii.AAC.1
MATSTSTCGSSSEHEPADQAPRQRQGGGQLPLGGGPRWSAGRGGCSFGAAARGRERVAACPAQHPRPRAYA